MSLGKRLQKARKKKGYTQETLSLNTGIDTTLISKYENDIKEIGLDNLRRIAEELDTSLDYLCYGKGPAYKEYDTKVSTVDIFDELFNKLKNGHIITFDYSSYPKIIRSALDEIKLCRSFGSMSYGPEDEAYTILQHHSILFYTAINKGLFDEAFNSTYDELETVLINLGVDIKRLLNNNK